MRKNRNISKIVLIGFMGTGKTALGAALARRLKRRHVDLDRLIEKREGKTVKKIFGDKGEAYFRSLESRLLKEALAHDGVVLSTGGGVVLKPENRRLIRKKGFVVWLQSGPGVIYRRLKGGTARPLLNVANPRLQIARLLREREPLYRSVSDVAVRTAGHTASSCASALVRRYFQKGTI